MRGQCEDTLNARDGCLDQPQVGSKLTRRPVDGVLRHGLQWRGDPLFDLLVQARATSTRSRCVVEAGNAMLSRAPAPLRYRHQVQALAAAIAVFIAAESAHACTMRACRAKPWAVSRRRVQLSNTAQSASLNSKATAWRWTLMRSLTADDSRQEHIVKAHNNLVFTRPWRLLNYFCTNAHRLADSG
jgi:hypothetical protein